MRIIFTLLALFSLACIGFAEETVLQSSTWTKINFAIKGTATLVETDKGIELRLDDAFKTKKAPDLKIFLNPKAVGEITNANALEGSTLIAALKKNKKAQSYILPSGTDLTAFKSVLIHCEKYSKAWGGFNLIKKDH